VQVTSAATERSFSTFAWIHSKKRNRLTSDRAAKITYLAHNWKLMHETKSHNSKKIKQNHDEEIGAENLIPVEEEIECAENLIPVEEEIECESEPDYTESESDESESEPGKSESELLYSSEEDESE